ncbi:MAG: YceI family protein [Paracoccaceae bacterium]
MQTRIFRRTALALLGTAAAARVLSVAAGRDIIGPAEAAPARYVLDPGRSSVRFETDFGEDKITGGMPVSAADLTLDFANVANCRVRVRLDVSRASASFPFAAQALKGPKVLDARSWPHIDFQSSTVRRNGDGALVDGDITIRGVTRPVTLDAAIYRQSGTVAGDLSRLTVQLAARVNRSDFGATGWADMVSDEVRIDILARVDQAA